MRRGRWIVSLALIGALTLLAASALAAPAGAASGGTQQHGRITFPDQVFDDPDYCAAYGLTFHVVQHETLLFTTWQDASGNTVKVFAHHDLAFELSANGKTLRESDHYNNTFVRVTDSDPPQFTAVTVGNETHILGDRGIVLLDAGRIVEAASGEITFIAGPHPQFLGGTFCAALLP